jgi:hypothetical protein
VLAGICRQGLFEGEEGLRLRDIRNVSKAILCAEGAAPVPWTRPDDLAYAAKQPLPKLGRHYPAGFFIGLLNRNAHFVNARFNEAILRRAIDRADDGRFDLADLANGKP